jgi:hypothetical protein
MDSLCWEIGGIKKVCSIGDSWGNFFVYRFDLRWLLHCTGGHGEGVRFRKFQDSTLRHLLRTRGLICSRFFF